VKIELRPLSSDDMEDIRLWRNASMETLRTPYMLTEKQQDDYYRTVICNRYSTTRYWGLWWDCGDLEPERCMHFAGMGGIENIQWENRLGEISLLISPYHRGKGLGRAAVDAILDQAFNYLNLDGVWGECYFSCPATEFWRKLVTERHGYLTTLPNRKFYNGQYHSSLYFHFYRNSRLVPDNRIPKEYGDA